MNLLRRTGATLAAAICAAATLLITPAAGPGVSLPSAAAASCPAVEVIFARGRLEPAGAGQLGNALVGDLRAKSDKNIGLYGVNYPADNQIDMGANDMSARVQYNMANCPDTRLVLGGYSLGAASTDVVLALPMAFGGFKNPLPPDADQHIAAVALFGNGTQGFGPIGNFNPVYRERTIEMCHGDDPICNPGDPNNFGTVWPDHLQPAYIDSGMVDQAADFVAGRL
ncbi:cutinase family protein [soil metagenome]